MARVLGNQHRSLFVGESAAVGASVAAQWLLLGVVGGLLSLAVATLVARRVPGLDTNHWGTAGGVAIVCATAALAALPTWGQWPDLALWAALTAGFVALAGPRGWPRWLPLAVATVALVVRWQGDRRAAFEAPDRVATGPDVVLITLDTFRADHVGAIGGFKRPVSTPHLDALAASGALFTHGVSPVPLTLPAHATMHTGRAPNEVGVLRNGHALASDARTVAQDFAQAGYRTGAFVSSRVLIGRAGLDRGFAHYDDRFDRWSRATEGGVLSVAARVDLPVRRRSQRRGDLTVDRALRWLDGAPGPAFLWVHLYDPHSPYAPPEPWADAYDGTAADAPGNADDLAASPAPEHPGPRAGRRPFPMMRIRDVRPQVAKYAGEISWTDALVGRLVAGLDPDSVVVVAADHGESLFEHGYVLNHGSRVYEPSIRVPIVVRAREVAPGTRIDAPTPLTGIAPTLRHLAGLPADGDTLFASDDAEIVSFASTQEVRPTFDFNRMYRVAFRRGAIKWIVDGRGNVERYDLSTDPGELDDLARDGGTEVDALGERGMETLRRIRDMEHTLRDLGPELQEELRALGYVE